MLREHDMIDSKAMGRPMHVWRYGHYGPPVLVFPSAAGMAHEWEANGMIDTLADWLNGGRIKLYCTESNVSESWTRRTDPAQWRIKRHQAYEQYITQELVPRIRADCHTPDILIAVTGTSMGAFYSANFALKFPHMFHYGLCMSGRYDATSFTEGYSNEDIYFNNPMAFTPNMHGEQLAQVQANVHLTLVCGQGRWEDGNIEQTQRMADILKSKSINHQRDLWGHDVDHNWTWWRRQARQHLGDFIHRHG